MKTLSTTLTILAGFALGDAILLARHGLASSMLHLCLGFVVLAALAELRRPC